MSGILNLIAISRWGYGAGTSGTYTIPAGAYILSGSCYASGASATLTITPGGPNQTGTAGDAIPIPAGVPLSLDFLMQLGPGSTLAFASTTSYVVTWGKPVVGA